MQDLPASTLKGPSMSQATPGVEGANDRQLTLAALAPGSAVADAGGMVTQLHAMRRLRSLDCCAVAARRGGKQSLSGGGRPLPDELLPGYTVVLPLYREAAVAAQLMDAMCALDYPTDRLQVLPPELPVGTKPARYW